MSVSVIDEIKERLDIVDVISSYIPLQKAGRNFRAVCPFHHEKTPSFYVFPDRGSWHCFGACGTGGDVITFVQKKENLDFREALEVLARRAGVDLERERNPQVASLLNTLREINELAASFYQHQLLNTPEGAVARAYVERRQFTPETTATFRLGYAPNHWDSMVNYLRSRNITPDQMETAGLVVRRDDGGVYDRFRHRLVIPIRDSQGRVIGFGGRILEAGEPKYLNTSQTPLFDKSSVIFALDQAKRAISSGDQTVIVEGYMDVISAHQAGFKNVVAAMGTAVTAHHLQRLSRYTRNFVFALDADAAGMSATLRSIQTAREALANSSVPVPQASGNVRYETRLAAVVKIAFMPAGQDPDDVLRRDPAEWKRLIAEAVPLLDFYFAQAAESVDLKTAHGKAQLVRQLVPTISEIDDVVERRHYVGRLASLAGVTEREIDFELESFARQRSRRQVQARGATAPSSSPPPPDAFPPQFDDPYDEAPPPAALEGTSAVRAGAAAPSEPADKLEGHVLAHLLARSDLLTWADRDLAEHHLDPLCTDDFEEAANRAIFDAQQEFLYSSVGYAPGGMAEHLDAVLQARVAELQSIIVQFEDLRDEQRRKDLVDSILRLRRQRLRKSCRDLELLLRSSDPADPEQGELGRQLVHSTQQQKLVERAIHARSHTGRWIKDQQRITW